MRVETERSRNGYRTYSNRKHNEHFQRKTYRHDNHYYHSSRHHHNDDYSLKRIGNSPPSYYTDPTRFDRQTNNRDIYSKDQPILNSSPPPTDLYYIRERDSSIHYNDSERNRYYQYPSPTINKSDQFKPTTTTRRENSYRNEYRPSMDSTSYNEVYRTSDYQNRSERYDISQNRNCSIAAATTTSSSSSPVYYQNSSSYNTRDEYPSMREVDYRTRDYRLPTPPIDHRPPTPNYRSYRNHSDLKRLRSNFRPIRR